MVIARGYGLRMPTASEKPTCFIAMPITTLEHDVARYSGDADHWVHVRETLFVRAVERAGFAPIRPIASGSHMIHAEIIKHLERADMVLCDLSSHNPNVFFELGVRTSLDKPIALVRDEHTDLPFDTSGINTHRYASTLLSWEIDDQVEALTEHLHGAVDSCAGRNPMWRHFGLTITAEQPDTGSSASEAKLELIFDMVTDLRSKVGHGRSDVTTEDDLGSGPDLGRAVSAALEATSLQWTLHSRPDDSVVVGFPLWSRGDLSASDVSRLEKAAGDAGYRVVGLDRSKNTLGVVLRSRNPFQSKRGMGQRPEPGKIPLS